MISVIHSPNQEYMGEENNDLDTKDWDFPKIHSQQHLFDDIVAKGATRNYNTKPNESLNRPLKAIYLNQTNFRDVAEQVCQMVYCHTILTTLQILHLIHLEYLVSFIRAKINKLDYIKKEQEAEGLDVRDQMAALSTATTAPEGTSHVYLGAPEKNDAPLSELTKPAGLSVSSLVKLVETYINSFRTREEGHYRVQKEHMVIKLSLF